MTAGRKTGGKDFQKGNTFGKGRPVLPDDLKSVQLLGKAELKAMISKYLGMTPDTLHELAQDVRGIKALDLIIIQFIAQALKGDHYKAEWLIQRSIGKVTEEQEVKDESTAHSKLIEYIKERAENK